MCANTSVPTFTRAPIRMLCAYRSGPKQLSVGLQLQSRPLPVQCHELSMESLYKEARGRVCGQKCTK